MVQLKGNYIFEKWLYLTLLSSQLVPDGYVEYYTFTENALIITDVDGNQNEFPITYQKTEVSPEAFAEDFFSMEPGPVISGYQSCYLLTDDEGSYPYRVYAMDNEIWLAYFQTKYVTNTKGPTEKVSQIWSVYQIVPYDGEIPA